MCIVSAVMDYGRRDIWPNIPSFKPSIGPLPQMPPNTLPPVPPSITPEYMKHFLELYAAAKKFDEATGQPDCEDPQKMEVLKRIEERLALIEQKLDDHGIY